MQKERINLSKENKIFLFTLVFAAVALVAKLFYLGIPVFVIQMLIFVVVFVMFIRTVQINMPLKVTLSILIPSLIVGLHILLIDTDYRFIMPFIALYLDIVFVCYNIYNYTIKNAVTSYLISSKDSQRIFIIATAILIVINVFFVSYVMTNNFRLNKVKADLNNAVMIGETMDDFIDIVKDYNYKEYDKHSSFFIASIPINSANYEISELHSILEEKTSDKRYETGKKLTYTQLNDVKGEVELYVERMDTHINQVNLYSIIYVILAVCDVCMFIALYVYFIKVMKK